MKIIEKLIDFTEEEKKEFIKKYGSSDYQVRQVNNELQAWGYDDFDKAQILLPEPAPLTPEEAINLAKEFKIQENDNARDIALNQGVIYQGILFDSDTDQKANLLGAVLQMSDEDTIEWYGMNNNVLVCTKQDLLNIGGLITQLHTFCWTKNAEIKNEISEAATIEEVENIEIDYEGVN